MLSPNFGASVTSTVKILFFVAIAMSAISNEATAANSKLPRTSMSQMAYAPSSSGRSGLPATSLDSFVAQANKAGVADQIYGDEGGIGLGEQATANGRSPLLPPYMGFTAQHRINAGIRGEQDKGLSTGHGSRLPDAWGRDEFIGGQEFSQGGYNNNAYSKVTTPDIQVSNDMPPVAPSFRNNSEYDLSGISRGASIAIAPAF